MRLITIKFFYRLVTSNGNPLVNQAQSVLFSRFLHQEKTLLIPFTRTLFAPRDFSSSMAAI